MARIWMQGRFLCDVDNKFIIFIEICGLHCCRQGNRFLPANFDYGCECVCVHANWMGMCVYALVACWTINESVMHEHQFCSSSGMVNLVFALPAYFVVRTISTQLLSLCVPYPRFLVSCSHAALRIYLCGGIYFTCRRCICAYLQT